MAIMFILTAKKQQQLQLVRSAELSSWQCQRTFHNFWRIVSSCWNCLPALQHRTYLLANCTYLNTKVHFYIFLRILWKLSRYFVDTFKEHVFVYNKGELPDVQRGGAGADGLVQHPLQRGVPRRALHDARVHPHLLLRPHDHRQPPLLQVGAVTKRHACK